MNQMTSSTTAEYSEPAQKANTLIPIENYCTYFSFSLVLVPSDGLQTKARTRKTIIRTMTSNPSFSSMSFFFSLVAPVNIWSYSDYRGKHVLNASGAQTNGGTVRPPKKKTADNQGNGEKEEGENARE